jgi:hypothetical protein
MESQANKIIAQTLRYFLHWDYIPTRDELIYLAHGTLSSAAINHQYKKDIVTKIALQKIRKMSWFIFFLRLLPTVYLCTITGSISMLSANEKDDIDFFIITKPKTLFTTRFIVLTAAFLLGIKRSPGHVLAKDKACCNLWFDYNDTIIRKEKQILYIAHELMQMRIVVNRKNTLEHLLNNNIWIYQFLPNSPIIKQSIKCQDANIHTTPQEYLYKTMQLAQIKKTKTKEYVSDTQLWFFPIDKEFN